MSRISTHILDLGRGRPASGVDVRLQCREGERWAEVARALTDSDGRIESFPGEDVRNGEYRLVFSTGDYFERRGKEYFHPRVEISFRVDEESQHYHVPLLLSPFGYSTYRGS